MSQNYAEKEIMKIFEEKKAQCSDKTYVKLIIIIEKGIKYRLGVPQFYGDDGKDYWIYDYKTINYTNMLDALSSKRQGVYEVIGSAYTKNDCLTECVFKLESIRDANENNNYLL